MPDNKSLAQAYFDKFGAGDLDSAAALMTADCAHHLPGLGGDHAGPTSWRRSAEALRAAFPDLKFRVHRIIAEGDRAAARVTWTGTHRGAFAGAAATGKPVEVNGTSIFRIKDQHIAEHWAEQDIMSLHQQIGLIAGRSPPYQWTE